MRFRTSQAFSSQFDRRLSGRLLGYVAIIAFVLIGLEAFRERRHAARQSAAPTVTPGESSSDLTQPPSEPDSFESLPGDPNAVSPRPKPGNTPTDRDNRLLDKALLTSVRDNTVGIRSDEAEAFFAVLDHARREPPSLLEKSAQKDVLYINLMSNPDTHRGDVVTFVGDAWRLDQFPAAENPHKLTTLYEAWVFSSDSGEHPIRVVASSLGAGLKLGENQRTPVRITGYFFKREGYRTSEGLHVAPTILARQIDRYHSPLGPPPTSGLPPLMLAVVGAIGLIFTVTLLSFAWSERRSPLTRTYGPTLRREHAAMLEAANVRPVEDQLRELSERELYGEPLTPRRSPATTMERDVELPTPTPPTRVRRLPPEANEPSFPAGAD